MVTLKQKFLKILSILVLATIPLPALAQSVDPLFNPSKIIDDKVFSDMQTFGGPDGIQKFLLAKNSVLANTSPDFLIKLKEPSATLLKQGLDDPEPNLDRLRTAAQLIWDAAQSSRLNPQVILVTLNKEQGLITGTFSDDGDLQTALDHAMGFACPDSGGCGSLFPGFYFQLFGNFDSAGNRYLGAAKSLMKSFSASGGRGPVVNGQVSHVGDTVLIENTLGGYDGVLPEQTIMLANNATAALYRYTPHVFNGNYNFWRFFQSWFKYPNGTLIKMAAATDTYIIQNGLKQLVPQFVAAARGLDLSTTVTVSPTEFDNYQTDQMLGPADNTIVAVTGDTQKYVFINNIKHPASDFVIKQRGLYPDKTLAISSSDSALFQAGPVLTPKDGTIIRGTTQPAVYLVSNSSLQTYSAFTFSQQKIKKSRIVIVSDAEIATYPKQGFVAPLDGTIFKAANSPAVYISSSGLKQPVMAEVFKNRKIAARSVVTLSVDEVSSMPIGGYATPADRSFFSVSENGLLYEFKGGAKDPISTFVATQRSIKPDFTTSQAVAISWADGIAIPPKDGSVVKGDSASDQTIYLVQNSQLRPLTYLAYKNRKITPKKITTLPQAEVDAYAKGDTLAK